MMEKLNFKNDLFNRREVKLLVKASSNPGEAFAKKEIAGKFKAIEDAIVVRSVKSKFGRDSFLIDAFVYDSVEDKDRVEPKKKEKKKKSN
jgi:ribosomal protein S24E